MSEYLVGSIVCKSDFLAHYGVPGMKWGTHKHSAAYKMDTYAINKTLAAMQNPYRARNNNRPMPRQKRVTMRGSGVGESPYNPNRNYEILGNVQPAGGRNNQNGMAQQIRREASIRDAYDRPHHKPLMLIDSDKKKQARIKKNYRSLY